ncbi:MAG: 16S rRNA (adenine(1518)-N(6)/adenine(1519)-N(6))-dimethyltransferase RsmA [Bacteroides sp.]|nr:16S rRNA (adenine(1518)-N(6)/adenine(1519)-N(6))-dimethyltransferase RsmA [Bacteroides sp.]MDY2973506.1 16S rRNA (adenine(1518)-N(6)/adenine(1519)-N(6))-dimethyltransferase RsmA [Candidatus Cryptobacteroides sp.]
MEVRAKKALGQHFLTDQNIAKSIVAALQLPAAGGKAVASEGKVNAEVASVPSVQLTTEQPARMKVLEIGPGMGVLSQYLLQRQDVDLRMIEIDDESVEYLESHFPQAHGRVIFGDFLKLDIDELFPEEFHVIGNFPYNISSQIFFRIIDYRNRIPQTVCMIQKEVAERIAEKPGSKTYGILSVLLQAWYDIEYLFTVGSGAFAPPPKVQSAVIKLTRNRRTSLGCDENAFKNIVKTAFGQRRKTLRNSLKPIIAAKATKEGWDTETLTSFTSAPVFELRPERLSVEDFIGLTNLLT